MILVKPRPHPPARPHGELSEPLPGIHFVTGTIAMPGPLPVRSSRAMTIVKSKRGLALINTVRLDDAGLRARDTFNTTARIIIRLSRDSRGMASAASTDPTVYDPRHALRSEEQDADRDERHG